MAAVGGGLSGSGSAGIAALAPGDHRVELTFDGRRRSYLVHVPSGHRGRLPVVLNFHGGGGSAGQHQRHTGMDEVADREKFAAVYPNGTGPLRDAALTWNAGTCCGYASSRKVDDVGFVLDLLDDLARRLPIDRRRVYATGLSNGAMMAYSLAAATPTRIAAIAPVAGATTVRFSSARPVPVLHVHSVDDPRAPYRGGFGSGGSVDHVAVEQAVMQWARHNGCSLRPAKGPTVVGRKGSPDEGHSATRLAYRACRADADVVLWKLSGAGHVCPGGARDYLEALLGPDTRVIDVNERAWAFFSRFALPTS